MTDPVVQIDEEDTPDYIPLTDAERRSVEDFYAHRALVLKRIQQALEIERAKNRK